MSARIGVTRSTAQVGLTRTTPEITELHWSTGQVGGAHTAMDEFCSRRGRPRRWPVAGAETNIRKIGPLLHMRQHWAERSRAGLTRRAAGFDGDFVAEGSE